MSASPERKTTKATASKASSASNSDASDDVPEVSQSEELSKADEQDTLKSPSGNASTDVIPQDTPSSDPSADTSETAPLSTITEGAAIAASNTEWQAVWSPQYNAYYFVNTKTNETTWTNPLAPPEALTSSSASPSSTPQATASSTPSTSTATYPSTSQSYEPTADDFGGIDPDLAYLDPSLAHLGSSSNSTSSTTKPAFTAKFDARSGRFAGGTARDPSHLSEYERAKRMSQAYFDVSAWEQDVQERDRKKREAEEEAGGAMKKKKPTKADLERYKQQKLEKKKSKNAWLRN